MSPLPRCWGAAMKASVEFLGFAGLAAMVHLAVFAATLPDGTDAGGADGAQIISRDGASIASADEALMALVEAWDRPPDTPEPVPAPHAPSADQAASSLPADMPDLPHLPQAMGLPQSSAQSAPQITPPPALFSQPQTRDTPRPRARPDPRAAQPQQARPQASRAQGQGRAAEQGQGAAQTRSGSAPSANALAQWGGGIRNAIQRQQGRASGRGVVHVQLSVSAGGQLANVFVTQSSGNASLDNAALQAVRRARLPRAPAGISGTHSFNLPVRFQ